MNHRDALAIPNIASIVYHCVYGFEENPLAPDVQIAIDNPRTFSSSAFGTTLEKEIDAGLEGKSLEERRLVMGKLASTGSARGALAEAKKFARGGEMVGATDEGADEGYDEGDDEGEGGGGDPGDVGWQRKGDVERRRRGRGGRQMRNQDDDYEDEDD